MDLAEATSKITLDDSSNAAPSEAAPAQHNIQGKRTNYIEWSDYFMATAVLASLRSKDPSSQVGACVVDPDKKIVGIGYNGMPTGCHDDDFPWGKNTASALDSKYLYVCHAEMNAILNKNAVDVKDCTVYVGLFPCNECAKIIIQSGIKEVVYLSDKHATYQSTIASKKMFDAVGIKYWQYTPKQDKIVLDFSAIDWNKNSPRRDKTRVEDCQES